MPAWVSAFLSPITVVLLVVLLVTFWVLKSSGKSCLKLPPGPYPLPIIGNLHSIDLRRQDLSFIKLSEKYGPVFTLHYGPEKVVVLTGLQAVKEALVTKADMFKDRASITIFNQMQKGNGLFFSLGEQWKATRRYTLSRMRDLGMGKMRIEEKILEELQFLAERIESFEGKPFRVTILNPAPANIILTILLGNRFDYNDPVLLTVMQIINEVIVQLGTTAVQIYNAFPFLGSFLTPPKTILKKFGEGSALLSGILSAHKQAFSENNLRDYIDTMLLKQQEETSKAKKMFHDANILASVIDLILAGTETTATTLQWAILLLLKYPEIERKVEEEIKTVIGLERLPCCEDRKQLPFVNAVVHEVQRFISLLPHLAHQSTADTQVCGYFIPKGTTVIPSLTTVLYDKTQWETPFRFNPNHFLDAEGRFVMKEAFLPFSAGQRRCAGETLAKMEIFLFFVGLYQKFKFQLPSGMTAKDLDLIPEITFVLRPKHFSVCAVPRS